MKKTSGSEKSATLNDVAKHANVSYQTVSRVINNHPNVAERTRERVKESIRLLGYRPNLAARSLVTNSSNTIAIISFGTTYYGPSQMVANITQTAKAHQFHVALSTVEELEQSQIESALNDLQSLLIDGIIVIAPIICDCLSEIRKLAGDIPLVQIDVEPQHDIASVVIEQAYGTRIATQHLIELGHTQIAEISGPLNWHDAIMRHKSWQATMQAHQLSADITIQGDWSSQSGYEAAQKLLQDGAKFTGLVVGNDQMALGAISAFYEAGLRIPEDVSIVGFDDIPEAAFFVPPLTTVRQDFAALGEQSVDYLISLIKNPKTPIHQRILHPELIVRNSTKKYDLSES